MKQSNFVNTVISIEKGNKRIFSDEEMEQFRKIAKMKKILKKVRKRKNKK